MTLLCVCRMYVVGGWVPVLGVHDDAALYMLTHCLPPATYDSTDTQESHQLRVPRVLYQLVYPQTLHIVT